MILRRRVDRDRHILRWKWPALHLPLWLLAAAVAVFLTGRAVAGLWWLAVHPRAAVTLAGVVSAVHVTHVHGWQPLAAAAVVAAVVSVAWRAGHRPSWDRWAAWPVTARARRIFVYRRQWQPAMVTTGLALPSSQGQVLPTLERVVHRPGVDRVLVGMCPGQDMEDWTRAGPRLARVFGATEVRARSVPNRTDAVDLWCVVRDPLDRHVPIPAGTGNLDALPVAVTEDGATFTIPLSTSTGSHLLIAGETGSGKGSVLWAIVSALEPARGAGLVRLWGVDPKGGMELQAGAHLFDRFAYGDTASMVALLEAAVAALRRRTEDLRAHDVRRLEPTPDRPLIVIIIDELAALLAYVTDASLKARARAALEVLLSQGRAPGVVVVAAAQDPRKETLAMRDLFPRRVALRTAEAAAADMILGEGSRARGARTDHIPHRLPGVAYVKAEGQPDPVRVRFPYLTDADVRALGRPVAHEGAA